MTYFGIDHHKRWTQVISEIDYHLIMERRYYEERLPKIKAWSIRIRCSLFEPSCLFH